MQMLPVDLPYPAGASSGSGSSSGGTNTVTTTMQVMAPSTGSTMSATGFDFDYTMSNAQAGMQMWWMVVPTASGAQTAGDIKDGGDCSGTSPAGTDVKTTINVTGCDLSGGPYTLWTALAADEDGTNLGGASSVNLTAPQSMTTSMTIGSPITTQGYNFSYTV
eukprot:UN29726